MLVEETFVVVTQKQEIWPYDPLLETFQQKYPWWKDISRFKKGTFWRCFTRNSERFNHTSTIENTNLRIIRIKVDSKTLLSFVRCFTIKQWTSLVTNEGYRIYLNSYYSKAGTSLITIHLNWRHIIGKHYGTNE